MKRKAASKILSIALAASMVIGNIGVPRGADTVKAAAFDTTGKTQVTEKELEDLYKKVSYKAQSVHDPSVIKVGEEYYVFGSHRGVAKTSNLTEWTSVGIEGLFGNGSGEILDVDDAFTNNLFHDDISISTNSNDTADLKSISEENEDVSEISTDNESAENQGTLIEDETAEDESAIDDNAEETASDVESTETESSEKESSDHDSTEKESTENESTENESTDNPSTEEDPSESESSEASSNDKGIESNTTDQVITTNKTTQKKIANANAISERKEITIIKAEESEHTTTKLTAENVSESKKTESDNLPTNTMAETEETDEDAAAEEKKQDKQETEETDTRETEEIKTETDKNKSEETTTETGKTDVEETTSEKTEVDETKSTIEDKEEETTKTETTEEESIETETTEMEETETEETEAEESSSGNKKTMSKKIQDNKSAEAQAEGTVAFGKFDAGAWCLASDGWTLTDNAGGSNLWAPDIIYNETMDKYCMYLSLNGEYHNSVVILLTSDDIKGPYAYQGPIVYSGFTAQENNPVNYNNTDIKYVFGEGTELPERYQKLTNIEIDKDGKITNATDKWGEFWPHAIDPAVFYDDGGNLWMIYGSWSGGIYALELDENTGLRDYTVSYESDFDEKGQSVTSDPYFGTKIAGGYYNSGEGPYIEKIGKYYYLFMSYGFYAPNGGYSMRIFRSENPDGPYVDTKGTNAIYEKGIPNFIADYAQDVSQIDTRGMRLMTYYQWDHMAKGEVAQGHNSALQDDDGRAYVIYHTKFNDNTAGHELRVHELFRNKNDWIVASPFAFANDTALDYNQEPQNIAGEYEIIVGDYSRGYDKDSGDGEMGGTYTGPLAEIRTLHLTDDKKITENGSEIGTWSVENGKAYATLTINGASYSGVFAEVTKDSAGMKTLCFTGVDEATGITLWGARRLEEIATIADNVYNPSYTIPTKAYGNLNLPTKGTGGAVFQWESQSPNIISDEGIIVKQPEKDTNVTFTMTMVCGTYYYQKEYIITIVGTESLVDGKYLVGEAFTNDPQDVSSRNDGSLFITNPFYISNTGGMDLSGGVSIEFDARHKEGADVKDSVLGTLIAFNDSEEGKLYFTQGSYLGYNAKGGFYDANLNDYSLVKDYIEEAITASGNTTAHVKIVLHTTGFSVYMDDNLAYDQSIIQTDNGSGTVEDYSNVLEWLQSSASKLYLGYGSWWKDKKADAEISNMKFYVNQPEDESAIVDNVIEALKEQIPTSTKGNLKLPTEGSFATTIEWASSDENIIATDGTVNTPDKQTDVTLTATISKGSVTKTVTFIVTVEMPEITNTVIEKDVLEITASNYINYDNNPFSGKKLYNLVIDYKITYTEQSAKNGWDGIFAFYNTNSKGRVSFQTNPYICYNNGAYLDINHPNLNTLAGNYEVGQEYHVKIVLGTDNCKIYVNEKLVVNMDENDSESMKVCQGSTMDFAEVLNFISECDKFTWGVGLAETSYWNTEICNLKNIYISSNEAIVTLHFPDKTIDSFKAIIGNKVVLPDGAGEDENGKYVIKWYIDEALTKAYNIEERISNDIELYGKYEYLPEESKTVTITLHYPDDTMTELIVAIGDKAVLPQDEGEDDKGKYTIKWYVDKALTMPYNSDTEVSEDIDLYGKRVYDNEEIKTFTVTLYYSGEILKQLFVEVGNPVILPNEGEDEKGKYSIKWYTDEKCTIPYSIEEVVTQDINLYATYIYQGEDTTTAIITLHYPDETTMQLTVTIGDKAVLPNDIGEDEKGKYTIKWYTDKALTMPYNPDTAVTENIDLYAKRVYDNEEIKTAMVTLYYSGEILKQLLVEVGNPIILPNEGEDKNGKYTIQWYTDETCTILYNTDEIVTQDMKLYAKYNYQSDDSKTVVITFHYPDGTTKQESVNNGDKVIQPTFEATDENGKYGIMWYADESQTILYDFTQPVTENIYLYGRYYYFYEETNKDPDGTETTTKTGIHVGYIGPQEYTGKAIKPAVVVYDGTTILTEKKDYKISYSNNKTANQSGKITITPCGNYEKASKFTIQFKIVKRELTKDNTTINYKPELNVKYNGRKEIVGQTQKVTLKYGTLKIPAKDYTVKYFFDGKEVDKLTEEGTYQMVIKTNDNSNFNAELSYDIVVTNKVLTSALKIKVPAQNYSGEALMPVPQITYKNKNVEQLSGKSIGDLFDITYADNTNAGTASIIVTAKEDSDYCGSKTATFQIKGTPISRASIAGFLSSQPYTGEELRQNITLSIGGRTLTEGTDYQVAYTNHINVGKAVMTITGLGEFSGNVKKTYTIAKVNLKQAGNDIKAAFKDTTNALTVLQDKSGAKPEVVVLYKDKTLVPEVDYTVSYTNNKAVGSNAKVTVKGIGNYTGQLKNILTFAIQQKDISDESILVKADDVKYAANGKYKAKLAVYDHGTKLSAKEYTIGSMEAITMEKDESGNETQCGTAKVTITGAKNYKGTKEVTINIKKMLLSSAKVTVKGNYYYANGDEIMVTADNLEVTIGSGSNKQTLIAGKDFVVDTDGYSNNRKAGKATLTIQGIGEYGGTKTVKFTILPKWMKK